MDPPSIESSLSLDLVNVESCLSLDLKNIESILSLDLVNFESSLSLDLVPETSFHHPMSVDPLYYSIEHLPISIQESNMVQKLVTI
jgi:hypothetical protein